MKKTAIYLMFFTIIAKVLGFGRELALSYFYGTSSISDAYLISLTIPSVIFSFVSTGIATCFIPIYSRIFNSEGRMLADRFTNNLISFVFFLSTSITLVVLLFPIPIVRLFASGFSGETLQLAVSFTKISILTIFISGLIFIFSAYLQLYNNYIIPVISGISVSVISILFIFLSVENSITLIVVGSSLSLFVQFLLIIFYVYKSGYRYKFSFSIKDKQIKELVILSLPVIIGVSVNQINVLVDKTLASQITVGGISALTYANKLNLFVQGIFVMTITTIVYPKITKLAIDKNMKNFKKMISSGITGVNLFVVPSTIFFMIFAKPLVDLIFGRGAFDNNAQYLTAEALLYYSIGMVGFGLREVLSRAFYSLQDTKTPMINAAFSVLINIFLNIILSRYMGIAGLALATSLSALICSLLLYKSLVKKIGKVEFGKTIISNIKILLSSLLFGILIGIIYTELIFFINGSLALIVVLILGAIIYIVLLLILKLPEITDARDFIVKKFRT